MDAEIDIDLEMINGNNEDGDHNNWLEDSLFDGKLLNPSLLSDDDDDEEAEHVSEQPEEEVIERKEEAIIEEEEERYTVCDQQLKSHIPHFHEELIQCWSPMNTNTRTRQPKRKSTSKKIDYSETKKRLRRSGRLKLSKKDESSKKIPRVARRSVLEIGKMKKLRKQTREKRLRNEKSMKLALMNGGYAPVRSINVTKTKEFGFSIREKEKFKNAVGIACPLQKPFERELRKNTDKNGSSFKNKPTMPVPFNFKLRQTTNDQAPKWESFTQATMKFQTKTPTRFRSKLKQEDLEAKNEHVDVGEVTVPITPKLHTRGRTRSNKVESRNDQEEKVLEEMKNFRFKASELNPKIIAKKGMYGVKSIPSCTATQPKPFDFEIEQRISKRPGREATIVEEDTSQKTVSKTTSSGKLRTTQPKPFSFEVKDKQRYTKKDEKIKEQILAEKKLHEFQASLLPSFSPDHLPTVKTKRTTRQRPFNISTGSLSYQSKLEITMKAEEADEVSKRRFKAQPARVTKRAPFKPCTGLIPTTRISKVKLQTDTRAEERELQQYWKKEKENIEEEEKAQRRAEEERVQEAEVKRLRKQAVHKANPIPLCKPMVVEKSTVPLTVPETPNLEVKKRAHVRLEKSRIAEPEINK